MDLKKRLAGELVTWLHDADAAREAQAFFERTVQRGQTPDDIPALTVSAADAASKRLSALIVDAGLASSSGEARRLINQGAVRLNDAQIRENVPVSTLSDGVLRVGTPPVRSAVASSRRAIFQIARNCARKWVETFPRQGI